MQCDMCGKDSELLLLTDVEGSQLSLCKPCSVHGKVLKIMRKPAPQQERRIAAVAPKENLIEVIVEDFPSLIKSARERLALTQEEFAKRMNERESVIHGLETGHHYPSMALARKLERALGIALVEQVKEEAVAPVQAGGARAEYTLGDFIKIRKRAE